MAFNLQNFPYARRWDLDLYRSARHVKPGVCSVNEAVTGLLTPKMVTEVFRVPATSCQRRGRSQKMRVGNDGLESHVMNVSSLRKAIRKTFGFIPSRW